jgi:3,4-dihydroxy 2-butanone 4-phosphate synthase/GTP cyclohydrolase II
MNIAQQIASAEEIIEEARNGRMFILVDDHDPQSEGDFIIPAQMATPVAINFMAKHGRGLICLALTQERAKQLELELMPAHNRASNDRAFSVSIEAKTDVTTGISAADRARTIAIAISSSTGAGDIVKPGHVFPLLARAGGVLSRAGHTEAAVDIARLAGLNSSGVICQIMTDDGNVARLPTLIELSRKHDMKIGTISDLIAYRMRFDHDVRLKAKTQLDSEYGGRWRVMTFENCADGKEHLVLQKGEVEQGGTTLVRMHSISLFADMLGERSDRSGLLQNAMNAIANAGSGILVLLRDTSATPLSQAMEKAIGSDRFRNQLRDYGVGAQILTALGVRDMQLLTNTPHKTIVALRGYGLNVVGESSF